MVAFLFLIRTSPYLIFISPCLIMVLFGLSYRFADKSKDLVRGHA
jgi:hypothetical protein